MKFPHIIVVCLAYFLSISFAVPLGSDDGQDPAKKLDKGKGKAPPSRPGTPTPADDPGVPLPGRNGWYTDPRTGTTTLYYGDDTMPEHMRHTDRNQQRFPENREPKGLADDQPGPNKNRNNALHNVPQAPPHPVTGRPRVKDEKLPNMFHNPNHDKTTTVEYRDEEESSGKTTGDKKPEEGKTKSTAADRPWNVGPEGLKSENTLLSSTKAGMERNKKNGMVPDPKGQLRSNPGWLPLDPNQRVAHEAPASLNSQDHRPISQQGGSNPPGPGRPAQIPVRTKPTTNKGPYKPVPVPSKGDPKGNRKGTSNDDPKTPQKKPPFRPGGTPNPGQMQLRPKPGRQQTVPPPKAKAPTKKPGTSKSGPSKLQEGTPAKPAGHIWQPPSQGNERPSHFGAPRPPTNSESRQPPRPQNLQQYQRQQAEAKAKQEAEQKAHQEAQDKANKDKGNGKANPNLDRFNAEFPPRPQQQRPAEAPGRMQTTHPSENAPRPQTPPPRTPARLPPTVEEHNRHLQNAQNAPPRPNPASSQPQRRPPSPETPSRPPKPRQGGGGGGGGKKRH